MTARIGYTRLLLLQVVFVLSWSSGFIGAKLGAQSAGAFNLFVLAFCWFRYAWRCF